MRGLGLDKERTGFEDQKKGGNDTILSEVQAQAVFSCTRVTPNFFIFKNYFLVRSQVHLCVPVPNTYLVWLLRPTWRTHGSEPTSLIYRVNIFFNPNILKLTLIKS